MSEQTNTTMLFIAILTSCEGQTTDLTEADAVAQECAEQMREVGLLLEPEPGHFTLSPRGMSMLMLIEKLRDYALSIE